MNKKFLMFGIMGLFALAMVSALVVSYISNTADVNVEVKQPFTTGFWDGSKVLDSLNLSSVYAGETISFENRIENLADVDTLVYLQYTITNDLNNVTMEDFSYVNINAHSVGLGDYHFFDGTFTELCSFGGLGHGANECEIVNGALILKIPNSFHALEPAKVFADLTFDSAVVPSTYTIETQVLIRE